MCKEALLNAMSCCRDRGESHLVIVWWLMVHYILLSVPLIVKAKNSYGSPYGALVASTVICFIGVGICILDIYAIHKDNALLMLPFFIWMIIATVILGIGAVISIVVVIIVATQSSEYIVGYGNKSHIDYIYAAAIVFLFFFFAALYSYFCYVIWLHRKEVLAKEVAPLRQMNTRMRVRNKG
ncbi:hypothetical protein FHG87_002798 [Trinorchestia longiramus]|nr:hypothetical protein FHG87_002798 [Trinorchestia longiramus]